MTKNRHKKRSLSKLLFLIIFTDRSSLLDGACRANRCTCSAICANISIDLVMLCTFADSVARAFSCTCAAAYTSVINLICHDETSY